MKVLINLDPRQKVQFLALISFPLLLFILFNPFIRHTWEMTRVSKNGFMDIDQINSILSGLIFGLYLGFSLSYTFRKNLSTEHKLWVGGITYFMFFFLVTQIPLIGQLTLILILVSYFWR